MTDRVPTKPGRVKLTKEDGTVEYAVLERADEPTQEGTPINKATLLSDATAAMLGGCSTPDGALAFLGKYNLHWWRRRIPKINKFVLMQTKLATETRFTNYNSSITISYGESVNFNESTGAITLNSNGTLTQRNGTMDSWNSFFNSLENKCISKPCYIKAQNDSKIYFLPQGSTFEPTNYDSPLGNTFYRGYYGYDNDGSDQYAGTLSGADSGNFYVAEVITSEFVNQDASDWFYIRSANRDEYPDSGDVDGYEYQYLGVPFDNAVGAPKIATGSYVGTGTYGADNPCSLTFDFVPKLLIVSYSTFGIQPTQGYWNTGFLWFYRNERILMGESGRYTMFSLNGNTLSWYLDTTSSSGAIYQCNQSGITYNYIAIG